MQTFQRRDVCQEQHAQRTGLGGAGADVVWVYRPEAVSAGGRDDVRFRLPGERMHRAPRGLRVEDEAVHRIEIAALDKAIDGILPARARFRRAQIMDEADHWI